MTAPGGHSGLIFGTKLGSGAIFETARILDAFYREVREPNLTFSAGVVLGGTKVEFDPATDTGTAIAVSGTTCCPSETGRSRAATFAR